MISHGAPDPDVERASRVIPGSCTEQIPGGAIANHVNTGRGGPVAACWVRGRSTCSALAALQARNTDRPVVRVCDDDSALVGLHILSDGVVGEGHVGFETN